MKRRVVIGKFTDLDLIDSIFSPFSTENKKSKFHWRAVCNMKKMHVRLFNSIFFRVILYFSSSPRCVVRYRRKELVLWSIIRVMIHQPASSFYEAQTGEFLLEAEELLKLRETLTRVYGQRTGKPLWIISEDMERDVFMSATEAQAHGIIDLVAVE